MDCIEFGKMFLKQLYSSNNVDDIAKYIAPNIIAMQNSVNLKKGSNDLLQYIKKNMIDVKRSSAIFEDIISIIQNDGFFAVLYFFKLNFSDSKMGRSTQVNALLIFENTALGYKITHSNILFPDDCAEDYSEIKDEDIPFDFGGYKANVSIIDKNFYFVHVAYSFAHLLGYTEDEIKEYAGNNLLLITHPEDLKNAYQGTYKNETFSRDIRFRKKQGGFLWVKCCCKFNKNNGNIEFYALDISHKKIAENEIKTLHNTVIGGIAHIIMDDVMTIKYATTAFYELFGAYSGTSDNLLGLIKNEDRERLSKTLKPYISNDLPLENICIKLTALDGDTGYVKINGNKMGSVCNKALYLFIFTDITEIKTAEDQLLKECDRYRIAIENSAKMMFEYEVDTDTLYIFENLTLEKNRPYQKTVFYKASHSSALNDYVYKSDVEEVLLGIKNLDLNKMELRINLDKMNDIYTWVRAESSVVQKDDGTTRFIGTFYDIDKYKRSSINDKQLIELSRFSVSKDYKAICVVNTTNGTYERFSANNMTSFLTPITGDFDRQTIFIADAAIMQAEKQDFINTFKVKKMVECLNKTSPSECKYFQLNTKTGYRWTSFKYEYIDDAKKRIIIRIQDIDDARMEEHKNELIKQSYRTALNSAYDEIFQVDLSTGTCTLLDKFGNGKSEHANIKTYDEFIENFINLEVYGDDIGKVNDFFSNEKMTSYGCVQNKLMYIEFRRIVDAKTYKWACADVVAVNNSIDSDILLLIFIANIDERKKDELEQAKQEKRYGMLFRNTYHYFTEVDLDTEQARVKYVNATLYVPPFTVTSYENYYRYKSCGSIFPEYLKQFDYCFDLETWKNNFFDGEIKKADYGQKMPDGKIKYWSVILIGVTEDNKRYIFIYTKDITEMRFAEIKAEQLKLDYLYALDAMNDECFSINVTNNTYKLLKMNRISKILPIEGVYSNNRQYYSNEYVHPDDIKVFSQNFCLENYKKMYYENIRTNRKQVRLKYDKDYVWYEINAIVLPNKLNDDIRLFVIHKDISEEKQIEEERLAANKRLLKLMRNSYTEIFEVNFIENIIYYVKAGDTGIEVSLAKETYDEFVKARLERICFPDDMSGALDFFNRDIMEKEFSNGAKEIYHEARRFTDKYNGYRWHSYLAQPVFAEENAIRKLDAIIFIKDIHEAKKREEKNNQVLRDALSSAILANNAKSSFLSRMSHDIRTPMNAIIGMSTIAMSNIGSPEKVADCITKIGVSTKFLLSLINNILDMSRIESGKMAISETEFDFAEFINNIIAIVYPLATEKGVDLRISHNELISETYIGDYLRLNQVLINILTNAIKFTPMGGTVMFTIGVMKQKNDHVDMRFEIKDNGIGMSQEFMKVMFEPFEQTVESYHSGQAGTGLGLPISKNLVNLMNGDIYAYSEIGKGSEFIIHIPLKLPTNYIDKRNKLYTHTFNDIEVLVVDNDIISCETTSTFLTNIGIMSDYVTSGKEAVLKFEASIKNAKLYDIAIIDWKMPGLDGVETTKQIRRLVGPQTVIIVMSAYDWLDIEEEARKAGVNYFISKPLFQSSVYDLMVKITSEVTEIETQGTIKPYDFSGKRTLLVEDNELNMEIAKTLLTEKEMIVETAENGQIAVDMYKNNPPHYYDCILMDVRMPIKDGYEATSEIRSLDKEDSKTIPIIAITADAFKEDIDKTHSCGMNGCIIKPIDVNVMYRTISKLIFNC